MQPDKHHCPTENVEEYIMSVLVVGSVALDTIENQFGKVDDSPGGSALYFSSAASFFSPVNVVGVVGTDFDFAIIDFLKNRNVDLNGIYVEEGKTFRWGGIYHLDINKRDTTFTKLNVFQNFKPTIPKSYQNSEYIFLANIDPELQLQVLDQINNPRLVVLDTMNFWISSKKDIVQEVIKRSDIIILNDEETRQLTENPNLLEAGKQILSLGPKYLIIKKGEHGAMLLGKDSFFTTPAFPVKIVKDPTGAGDSFAGGFVGYLAKEKNMDNITLRKAVVYGSVIASFNVEDFSFNKLIQLNNDDLQKRFEKMREITQID
jgi:sugar/nucleoside kinase (ribokinase family)